MAQLGKHLQTKGQSCEHAWRNILLSCKAGTERREHQIIHSLFYMSPNTFMSNAHKIYRYVNHWNSMLFKDKWNSPCSHDSCQLPQAFYLLTDSKVLTVLLSASFWHSHILSNGCNHFPFRTECGLMSYQFGCNLVSVAGTGFLWTLNTLECCQENQKRKLKAKELSPSTEMKSDIPFVVAVWFPMKTWYVQQTWLWKSENCLRTTFFCL